MKIGIVCYPTFGGSGTIATELGKALAKKQHQVHFITYNQPVKLGLFSENILYHKVSIPQYPLFEYPSYGFGLVSKLVQVLRLHQLDILHLHYAIPHALAAFVAKQVLAAYGIHVPVITTLHGTDITLIGKEPAYQPVVSFSLNQSDGVTAVSQQLKKDTLANFSIKKEIRVIPNFVDIQALNKETTYDLPKVITTKEKLVVHVSNFRSAKRTLDVIRIFAIVQQHIPSKLLMIGDGPERSACEQLCADLNLIERVRFLGEQDAVAAILARADLFLLPSELESFGLAALEAMACKTPIISSNVGGLPELISNGVNGFLLHVGATQQMAKQAIYILQDEERLHTFKENAWNLAKKFDAKLIVPLYEDYYTEILKISDKY